MEPSVRTPIFFDLSFPHSYDVRVLEDLPGSGQSILYMPRASNVSGKDGLLLKVIPDEGCEWWGCFAFGFSPQFWTGVYATPHKSYLCVVSHGQAYLVNAAHPKDCLEVGIRPVRDVRVLPEENVLVLADYISVGAIGASGFEWRSPRVCFDGLKISDVSAGVLKGYGDSLDDSTPGLPFAIDLKTRKVLQSAYPFS